MKAQTMANPEEITALAKVLRVMAGSTPGVAQAGYVTVSATDLEYIAGRLDAIALSLSPQSSQGGERS